MKYYLIIVVLLANGVSTYAQDWPYPSSRWVYDMQSVGIWGEYEFLVGPDTLVEGYDGKHILLNQINTWVTGPEGETYTSQTGFDPFGVVFEIGDSLLYLDQPNGEEATVRLLYDYGASVGDSWLLKVDEFSTCLDSTYINVTSAGTITINGEERRYIDVTTTAGSDVILEGRAIERLGLIDGQGFGFFPGYHSVDTCLIYDGDETTFTCYSDDEIGPYPGSGGPCSFLSLDEAIDFPLSIYPNPASAFVNIEILGQQRIERLRLLDISGRLIMKSHYTPRLDVSNLGVGVYLLQLETQDGIIHTQKLTIE